MLVLKKQWRNVRLPALNTAPPSASCPAMPGEPGVPGVINCVFALFVPARPFVPFTPFAPTTTFEKKRHCSANITP